MSNLYNLCLIYNYSSKFISTILTTNKFLSILISVKFWLCFHKQKAWERLGIHCEYLFHVVGGHFHTVM